MPALRPKTRESRALCGFQHHNGENQFCFLFSDPIIVGLKAAHKPIILGSYNRKTRQVFAFVVLKPTQGSGFACSVPKPARTAKKTCFSHTALDCRHESSPHRARIMIKLGRCTYSPQSVRGFLYDERKSCFCFLFSDPITVDLNLECIY